MYEYKAKVLRVLDGDTVEARIDLGFDVFTKVHIRLDGTYAPEKWTMDGKIISDRLRSFLTKEHATTGEPVVIQTDWDRSFARWVGHIYVDGIYLNGLINQWVAQLKDY